MSNVEKLTPVQHAAFTRGLKDLQDAIHDPRVSEENKSLAREIAPKVKQYLDREAT